MRKIELEDKASILALDTFVKLMRCTETVKYQVHQHLMKVGITESQLAVLEVIYHKGSMNQQLIGHKILKSKSNLTTVLENLEKSGLIARELSPKDRRNRLVSLTEKGEALISAIFPEHTDKITTVFSSLSQKEQIFLGILCKKLGQSLEGK